MCNNCSINSICKIYELKIQMNNNMDINISNCNYRPINAMANSIRKNTPTVDPGVAFLKNTNEIDRISKLSSNNKNEIYDKLIDSSLSIKPTVLDEVCPTCEATTFKEDLTVCSDCKATICSCCATYYSENNKLLCPTCWEKA